MPMQKTVQRKSKDRDIMEFEIKKIKETLIREKDNLTEGFVHIAKNKDGVKLSITSQSALYSIGDTLTLKVGSKQTKLKK